MKAKVRLYEEYTGRSLNIITFLTEDINGNNVFTFDALTTRQRAKIERFFGKMNAYFTKYEILEIYK